MADVVLIGIVVLAFFAVSFAVGVLIVGLAGAGGTAPLQQVTGQVLFIPVSWANSLAQDSCLLAGNGQRSCSRRPFDLKNPLFALSQ
jgi:hypothetical protein